MEFESSFMIVYIGFGCGFQNVPTSPTKMGRTKRRTEFPVRRKRYFISVKYERRNILLNSIYETLQ